MKVANVNLNQRLFENKVSPLLSPSPTPHAVKRKVAVDLAPRPTPTSVPTSTPRPTVAPIVGLGVPRSAIQSPFEDPTVGFRFEQTGNDPEQIMGFSTDGQHALLLVGPRHNLRTVSLTSSLSNRQDVVYAAVYLTALPGLVLEGDAEVVNAWINSNLQDVIGGATRKKVYKGVTFILEFLSLLNAINLNIDVRQFEE